MRVWVHSSDGFFFTLFILHDSTLSAVGGSHFLDDQE